MDLIRGYTDLGTLGKWYGSDGQFVCHTLERPWADNKPFASCIPEGRYQLVEHESPKYGPVYALVGGTVSRFKDPGYARYGILIHAANWTHQLQGCIAPGRGVGILQDQLAVLHSQAGLNTLLQAIHDELAQGNDTVRIHHAEAIDPASIAG